MIPHHLACCTYPLLPASTASHAYTCDDRQSVAWVVRDATTKVPLQHMVPTDQTNSESIDSLGDLWLFSM